MSSQACCLEACVKDGLGSHVFSTPINLWHRRLQEQSSPMSAILFRLWLKKKSTGRTPNRIERTIAIARFPVLKYLAEFDWRYVPDLPKPRYPRIGTGRLYQQETGTNSPRSVTRD